jgi:hypothetical protein
MLQTKSAYEVLQDKLLTYGFEIEISEINREDWGKWDCNNGITLVVTKFGVLWVKIDYFDELEIIEAIEQLCPKGRDEFISPELQEMLSQ